MFAFVKTGVSGAGKDRDPDPRVTRLVTRLPLVTNRRKLRTLEKSTLLLYGSVAPTRKQQLTVGPEIRRLPPSPSPCPPRQDDSDSVNPKPQAPGSREQGAGVDIRPRVWQLLRLEPQDGRCLVFCRPVM